MRVLADQVLRLHVARRVLACALGAGLLAACGASGRPATLDSRQDAVSRLITEIREWRLELCLSAEPRADLMAFLPTSTSSAPVCIGEAHPNNEVCIVTTHVCDNAEAICEIANESDHSWAAEKCMSAKASCRDTHELCCANMNAPVTVGECN